MDPTRRISEALNDSTGFHVDVVAPLGVWDTRQHHVELLHAAPAAPAQPPGFAAGRRPGRAQRCSRSTIIFLISAMAFAGLRSFGQASVQFMMVWQR